MENIYNAIQNVYNMDKTTWQEVLAELYNLVSNVENKFELFENKFGSLLGEEVTIELKKMHDDGSLSSLINDKLLKEISEHLDNKVRELNDKKLNKTDVLSMINMGQDVKEAMTGGSVAVVGKNTVLTENIVDKQVTKAKTSFYKKTINLENKELQIEGKGILTNSGELYENPDLASTEEYISINCEYLSLQKFDSNGNDISSNEAIGLAFFDSNKAFLKWTDLSVTSPLKVPSNAKYIRFQLSSNTKGFDINILPQAEKLGYYLEQYVFEENEKINKTVESLINIKLGNSYKNKKVLLLGDSITALGNNNYGWEYHFRNIVKPSKVVNIAVNGCTWKDREDTPSYDGKPTPENSLNVIGNQVQKVINQKASSNANYSDFDVIIIACGTNDSFDVNTETIETVEREFITNYSTSNYTVKPIDSVDRKTFAGAMRYTYEKLYELYPNAIFFVTTPLQEVYETYQSIKAKGDLIEYIADRLSINTINTRRCGILNTYESPVGDIDYDNPTGSESLRKRDLSDGIHTGVGGAKKLGECIARYIINYFNF